MTGMFKLRFFDRLQTDDERMHIRQLGLVRSRPNHPNGDAVDVLCVGGRFDTITETIASRRAKADASALSERDGDVLVAQAVHDVPVTGLQSEPAA